ncbi:hypothetical protein G0Q06_05750 [Puniceicoccales bacterium CK1056]|uniref:Adenylate kinase n=1 Tax=Oceanipulchritudo coccoides TaxID=2706888 RepID=A0A6B2LZ73_9BACT|nr:hypothetical protein [Oceanipulchritudo coccoides]NDV61948.1 hypothetical protein [Oceanipulchritudo coccoides]
MLYFISGASRSGKTLVAERIFREHHIPYMSLDWLVMGFTNGIPEYGLHDKLFPDEIAERLWSFLNAICESMIWSGIDYVIEGEAILPELICEFLDKHPGKVRICFLGYTDVDIEQKVTEIRKHSAGELDWLTKEPDNYVRQHVENMVNHSRMIKEGCAKTGMQYFDTAEDFMASLDAATAYLIHQPEDKTS